MNKTDQNPCVLFIAVCRICCNNVIFVPISLLCSLCHVCCGSCFNTDFFTFAYPAQVGRKFNSQVRLNDLSPGRREAMVGDSGRLFPAATGRARATALDVMADQMDSLWADRCKLHSAAAAESYL